jgi:hypothetical protein
MGLAEHKDAIDRMRKRFEDAGRKKRYAQTPIESLAWAAVETVWMKAMQLQSEQARIYYCGGADMSMSPFSSKPYDKEEPKF